MLGNGGGGWREAQFIPASRRADHVWSPREAFGPGEGVEDVTPADKPLARAQSQGQPKHREAGNNAI